MVYISPSCSTELNFELGILEWFTNRMMLPYLTNGENGRKWAKMGENELEGKYLANMAQKG